MQKPPGTLMTKAQPARLKRNLLDYTAVANFLHEEGSGEFFLVVKDHRSAPAITVGLRSRGLVAVTEGRDVYARLAGPADPGYRPGAKPGTPAEAARAALGAKPDPPTGPSALDILLGRDDGADAEVAALVNASQEAQVSGQAEADPEPF